MSRIFGLKLEPVRRGIVNVSYYGPKKREPLVGDVLTVESERGSYRTVSVAHLVSTRINKMNQYVSNMYSVDVSKGIR